MKDNVAGSRFSGDNLINKMENYPNLKWIEAGINIMRNYGARHISISTICSEIGLSEKEFNQIYSDLEDYLNSLLDYWYEKETLTYIDFLEEIGGKAESALLTMVEIIHNIDKGDELAIRNWALRYASAQDALAKVDRTRLDVTIGLFKEIGFSEKESILRSKLFYTSTIGIEYTAASLSLEKKLEMCKLLMTRD